MTKEAVLEKNGFDFESFEIENEYSAKNLLSAMEEYAQDKLKEHYTQDEVRRMIQMIYSEFAELPIMQHTTFHLQQIIKREVEKHPIKPIKIFK